MVDSTEGSSTTLPLLKSDTSQHEGDNVVQVHYLRVQPASPDFVPKYESIDQNIDIELSTFVFSASPRPVIALYDFLMATFVHGGASETAANSGVNTPAITSPNGEEEPTLVPLPPDQPQPSSGKIKLNVVLSGVDRESFFRFRDDHFLTVSSDQSFYSMEERVSLR